MRERERDTHTHTHRIKKTEQATHSAVFPGTSHMNLSSSINILTFRLLYLFSSPPQGTTNTQPHSDTHLAPDNSSEARLGAAPSAEMAYLPRRAQT